MKFLDKIFTSSENEKKNLVEFFKSIAGTRIPDGDYSTILNQISIREARNIKLALESYPDLVLDNFNEKDFESKLEAEKIKKYRNNRPDVKRKMDAPNFTSGVRNGYYANSGTTYIKR